ncbi:MAG: hypothetical protein ACLUNO_00010 [Oscillospiraceae bacterium]
MRAAREAMLQGVTPDAVLTEAEEAMSAIGELTGASIREDITNRIFARFRRWKIKKYSKRPPVLTGGRLLCSFSEM